MANRTPTAEGARIAAMLEPLVAGLGYELEQVSVKAVGRRSVVRVVVDRDGGISLDDVAEVSRRVATALDEADDSGSLGFASYTLEVTSPGVDRPLTEARHWRRAVGRLIRTPIQGTTVEGRILSADEAGVVLDVNGESRPVPYADLGRGSIQVEFARKEGGGR